MNPFHVHPFSRDSRSGQALIESAFVIGVACLIFFGLLQLSRLYAGQAVATYAAMAGARARMVGFNDFMVHKAVRVAAIPNAGRMTHPEPEPAGRGFRGQARPGDLWDRAVRTRSVRPAYQAVEQSRIPLYMVSEHWGQAEQTLRYEHWPTVHHNLHEGARLLRVHLRQDFPLTLPFRGAFYADDTFPLRGGSPDRDYAVTRELHYPVYLE